MYSATKRLSGEDASVTAMNENSLLYRIRHLLARQFGVDAATIEADTGLVEQLYADSMDLLEMTHAINDEFGIEIDAAQLADMHTVGAVERVVAAMLRALAVSATEIV
ncbi:MAG TPA: phosphopantetheine-binding protein [Herbaspirillum sp.]|jgi:acyl carrier protein